MGGCRDTGPQGAQPAAPRWDPTKKKAALHASSLFQFRYAFAHTIAMAPFIMWRRAMLICIPHPAQSCQRRFRRAGYGLTTQLRTFGTFPRSSIERRTLMADDKTKTTPQDAGRISLSDDYEVSYWTQALGVSKERLAELVRQHGNSAEKVRRALGK